VRKQPNFKIFKKAIKLVIGVHYSGCISVPSVTSWRTTVITESVLLSYPNANTKPSVSVIINLRCGTVCACALWTSCLVQTLKFKTMQFTAGTDSIDTAWDKLLVPLAHLLYLFLGIFGCSSSITQLYGGPLPVLCWRGQATRTTRNSPPRKICGTKELQKSQKVAK